MSGKTKGDFVEVHFSIDHIMRFTEVERWKLNEYRLAVQLSSSTNPSEMFYFPMTSVKYIRVVEDE